MPRPSSCGNGIPGFWKFVSDFGMDELEFPAEWGYEGPDVWVIKTDNSPLSQGELF